MNVSMSRTAVAMLLMVSGAAMTQPYGPGASDTEIRLGTRADAAHWDCGDNNANGLQRDQPVPEPTL